MAQIDKLQKVKDEFIDDIMKMAEIAGAFDGVEIDETEKAGKIAEAKTAFFKEVGYAPLIDSPSPATNNRGGFWAFAASQRRPWANSQQVNNGLGSNLSSKFSNQSLGKWCECIEDIEYADKEIIVGLIELMEEFCSTMKQELKEKFATMERAERLGGVAMIKFVEKLIDILQNGRYYTSEEEDLGKESSNG